MRFALRKEHGKICNDMVLPKPKISDKRTRNPTTRLLGHQATNGIHYKSFNKIPSVLLLKDKNTKADFKCQPLISRTQTNVTYYIVV
jgi:hypothetical protein